jgi:cobalt-zinc-cadmium efflux system protein
MRPLVLILWITGFYMLAEAWGGYTSGSLALLADSGHMLTDVVALAMALFSGWLAKRPMSAYYPFGFARAEILAASLNGLLLMGLCIGILIEAISRFWHPQPVASGLMFWVAVGGTVVNAFSAWWLHRTPTLSASEASHGVPCSHGHQVKPVVDLSEDADENLNIRAAYLHILGDLLGSVGAVLASVCLWVWGWQWADPAISVVISLLILVSSVRLLLETVQVLMEGTPKGVSLSHITDHLLSVPGVIAVEGVKVWAISSGQLALMATLTLAPQANWLSVLAQSQQILKHHNAFVHISLQPQAMPTMMLPVDETVLQS